MLQTLIDFYYKYWKKWGWFGDYPDWKTAEMNCIGYASDEIIEKVRLSVAQVRDGKAAFERDSVLFYEPETHTELMNWLHQIVKKDKLTSKPSLRLLDFGGSLGSTYFQHKQQLAAFDNLIWCVVEQEKFVKIGKREFQNNYLKFELSLQDAIAHYQPNAILLSSVLMYIEKPYNILEAVFKSGISHIMIDRTPFIPAEKDRITVQIVPSYIYTASYPCWVFSEEKFLNFIKRYAQVKKEFTALDKMNILGCQYKGFILENRF